MFSKLYEVGLNAKRFAELELDLDDTIAETYYQLAVVETWTECNFEAAEPLFLRAIELRPGFADAAALYSHYLAIL